MERKFKDKLISILIALVFLVLGMLYQFNIMAEHYIFGIISYVLMITLLIISLLSKASFKTRIISLISSLLVLICAICLHFIIINNPYLYRYEKIDDGVKITKCVYKIANDYTIDSNDDLIIPSQLNGKDVKVIGANAFSKNRKCYSVIIPDSVEIIEEYAFSGADILNLKLSNNIKIIENSAFKGCSLQELNLPNSLEEIGDYAFEFATWGNIKYVNVPKSVKTIGASAFRGVNIVCIDNKELDGEYKNCESGYKIYHESIAYEYDNVIYVLHNNKTATIARIELQESIINLSDKIIYNNEEYIVTTIEKKAGNNCKFIEIIIPNTITTIKNNAFANNKNLTKIYIPSSVIKVEDNIFHESLNVKIYVEHDKKPENWHENWNGDINKREVVWSYQYN